MTEVVDHGATIADLRRRIAAVNPRGTREAVQLTPAHPQRSARLQPPDATAAPAPTRSGLALPEHLRPAFPRAGLPRGSTVELTGARGPAVSIVAAVTAAGGHVAVVDTPTFGLLAAHEQGADLSHVAVIGNAGNDPITVLSVLADGMDVIVWTPGATVFTPSIERGLAARLRTKETTLITLGAGLRRPDYRLDAQIIDYHGITEGSGLLSAVDTVLTSSGRNLHPTRTGIRLERVHRTVHASLLPDELRPRPATDIRTGT